MATPFSIAYVGQSEAMTNDLDRFSIVEVGLQEARSSPRILLACWLVRLMVPTKHPPRGVSSLARRYLKLDGNHWISQDCVEMRLDSLEDTAGFIERMPLPRDYLGWRPEEVRN